MSFFDRVSAYVSGKKMQHLTCPQRKETIARIFVKELQALGQGNAIQGAVKLSAGLSTDPKFNYPEFFDHVLQEALNTNCKAASYVANLWMRGSMAMGSTPLERAVQGLGDYAGFEKTFREAVVKLLIKENFTQLRDLCACTADCSERFKAQCHAESLAGEEDCKGYGQ